MRLCLLSFLLGLATVSAAQDRHNWESLGQLKTGDQVRLSLTARSPVSGEFRNWTSDQVTLGNVSAKKAEVLKVERYRRSGWSRGKTAAIGALIGFGGGFAIGAALGGGCDKPGPGICISRGAFGAGMGAVGAGIGAVVGATLPHHNKELIYIAK